MTVVLFTGALAGVVHVLTGPDHLAALAVLSVKARRRAWALGLRWGLGHAAGIFVVGILAFWFRLLVPIETLSVWAERSVGVALVGLGLWGFRDLFRSRLHRHTHGHDGGEHVHFHVHAPGLDHGSPGAHVHGHAAFGVGVLHGLAGTSHLLGILPALALPERGETAGYLLAFCAGTILAMTLFGGAVGRCVPRDPSMALRSYRALLAVASAASVLVGGAWLALPL